MNIHLLTKQSADGLRVAFGHFEIEEIKEMVAEGWQIASEIDLKFELPQFRKRSNNYRKVGVNKHGIPVMQ